MKIVCLNGKQDNLAPKNHTKVYIRNPEIYFFYLDLEIIVWAPYLGTASLVNRSELDFVSQNPWLEACNENIDYIKAGIYIPEGFSDSQKPEPPRPEEFNPRYLTLMTTAFCNLRCKYCYARGGQLNMPQLPFDAAKYLIDKFDFRSITFHGWGEPTYNWELIEKVVEYTRGIGITYGIGSNGIWFSNREKFTKFLVENSFRITLSYDGLPDITDKQRILPDGKSGATYEILATVNEFKKYGNINQWLTIRATVGRSGECRILKMCEHLKGLGFWSAKFEPLFATGRSLDYNNDVFAQPPELDRFAESISEAILWGHEHGFVVESTLFPANQGSRCSFCATSILDGIVLGTDLTLQACWEPIFITTTNSPEIVDSPFNIGYLQRLQNGWKDVIFWDRVNTMRTRYSYMLPDCPSCPVKCGGGCAKRSWENFGDLVHSGEDKTYCDSRRLILKKYLKARLTNSVPYKDKIDVAEDEISQVLNNSIRNKQSNRKRSY